MAEEENMRETVAGVSCKGNKELDPKPSERSGMHLKDIKQRNDVVRWYLM